MGVIVAVRVIVLRLTFRAVRMLMMFMLTRRLTFRTVRMLMMLVPATMVGAGAMGMFMLLVSASFIVCVSGTGAGEGHFRLADFDPERDSPNDDECHEGDSGPQHRRPEKVRQEEKTVGRLRHHDRDPADCTGQGDRADLLEIESLPILVVVIVTHESLLRS
jgi:hypothetical protein